MFVIKYSLSVFVKSKIVDWTVFVGNNVKLWSIYENIYKSFLFVAENVFAFLEKKY